MGVLCSARLKALPSLVQFSAWLRVVFTLQSGSEDINTKLLNRFGIHYTFKAIYFLVSFLDLKRLSSILYLTCVG